MVRDDGKGAKEEEEKVDRIREDCVKEGEEIDTTRKKEVS